MSTVNPDERERRLGLVLRPVVKVAVILVQFLAPGLGLLKLLGLLPPEAGLILIYVLVWVAVGLAAMFVPTAKTPHLIAAFILSYIGGLFLVIAVSMPDEPFDGFNLFGIVGPYLAAGIVLVLAALSTAALRRTRELGVDTIATVISAPVTGMVNYVTRQRLTLRFTDQQGVERFVRVGRTGGGYSPGDRIPLRYDPTRPWSKRSILVEGSGPTLFGGRRVQGGTTED